MQEQAARFAQHQATFAALAVVPWDDATGRARALAALNLYRTRAAMEEIGDALVRLKDGCYGPCLSCGRPIPFEHLEARPEARVCVACTLDAAPIGRPVRRVASRAASESAQERRRRGAMAATLPSNRLAPVGEGRWHRNRSLNR